MKYLRTKKGFTLVELIVTVTILSITSLLMLGIVANSINNYSTASVTSSEQDVALQIESDLINFARKATGVELIDNAGAEIPAKNETAFYVKCTETGFEMITADVEKAGAPPIVVNYVYNRRVDNIVITLVKLKNDKTDTTGSQRYVIMNYVIEMKDGYTIKGSVPMNNDMSGFEISGVTEDTTDLTFKYPSYVLKAGLGKTLKFTRST